MPATIPPRSALGWHGTSIPCTVSSRPARLIRSVSSCGETYIEGSTSYYAPFSRNSVTAAAGDYLHYGSSDAYEIHTHTAEGDLVRIIRSPRAFPLTRQDIDAVLAKASRPEVRRAYARMPFPETLPAYEEF
jgi:hypothetical protein